MAYEESLHSQGLALLFIMNDEWQRKMSIQVFSLSTLPDSLIPEHIPVIEALRAQSKMPFFS